MDLDGVGDVEVVALFDHPRDADEVDLLGKVVAPHDWRARKNEDVDVFPLELRGDSHGPANVAEPIGIMGIHQDVEGGGARHALSTASLRLPRHGTGCLLRIISP